LRINLIKLYYFSLAGAIDVEWDRRGIYKAFKLNRPYISWQPIANGRSFFIKQKPV